MTPITYDSIGVVQNPVFEPHRPEEIRGQTSHLCLKSEYEGAVSELAVGEHVQVIYHLHSLKDGHQLEENQILTRRIASRPNPIGITLVRIVSLSGSTITVVGLDAIDGSPILDIKPYKPIFDQPPVPPAEHIGTSQRPVIVLTGGPGGGKSTLLEELAREPDFENRFVALPEAVQTVRFTHISPHEKLFQRSMVRLHGRLRTRFCKRSIFPTHDRSSVTGAASIRSLFGCSAVGRKRRSFHSHKRPASSIINDMTP